jgi:hypothetical protein
MGARSFRRLQLRSSSLGPTQRTFAEDDAARIARHWKMLAQLAAVSQDAVSEEGSLSLLDSDSQPAPKP